MSYQLAPDVRYRRVLDEAVVICQQAAEVVGLNASGARILELIDEGRTSGEIIDAMAAEHNVEREVLETDVAAFLDELAAAGVICPTDEDAASPG